MGRIGFWQLLLDDRMSWWEAERINAAHDAADVAQGMADAAQFKAFTLEERVNQMSREIVMLRTALTVLTQTLKDTKTVDERLLDARLEAAMEEAAAALPRLPSGAPMTVNAALQQSGGVSPAVTLTCLRCRNRVAANTTLMTGDGPVCERCPT
jgi:hypothetical protein